MCDQQSLRSACAYAQSDQSLCKWLEYSKSVKLLTEQHLEFLSLKGGCTGSSESTLVKMPHCWKSHVGALMYFVSYLILWRINMNDPFLKLWQIYCDPRIPNSHLFFPPFPPALLFFCFSFSSSSSSSFVLYRILSMQLVGPCVDKPPIT